MCCHTASRDKRLLTAIAPGGELVVTNYCVNDPSIPNMMMVDWTVFLRTPDLDLLVFWHGLRLGFELKYSDSPDLTKAMHVAIDDLKLDRLFVVYPGGQSLKLPGRAELLSIQHPGWTAVDIS